MTAATEPAAGGTVEVSTSPGVTDGPLPRDPPPPPGWEDPLEGSAVLHGLAGPPDVAPGPPKHERPDAG